MKKLLVALLLTASLTPAAYAASNAELAQMCTDLSQIAKSIMGLRQQGVNKELVTRLADKDTMFKAVVHNMVEEAFAIPVEDSEYQKESAAYQFRLHQLVVCRVGMGVE